MNIDKDIIKIVDEYFEKNNLEDFMNYGADCDSYILTSFTDLYKDMLKKLNIEFKEICTENVSDGKYQTVVIFEGNQMLFIYTSAWNNKETLEGNLQTFMNEYNKLYGHI